MLDRWRTATKRICTKLKTKFMVVIPHDQSWNPSVRLRVTSQYIYKGTNQKREKSVYKKRWCAFAIANANPYLPHACGSFKGTLPLCQQRSTGFRTTRPASLIRRQRHYSGFEIPRWSRDFRDPPKTTATMFTAEAGNSRISSPTLRNGLSLCLLIPHLDGARVCVKGYSHHHTKWSLFCLLWSPPFLCFLFRGRPR